MDVLTKAQRSYCMSQIRAKNTKPEMLLRKLLWGTGLRGYRLHMKVTGRPDVYFPRRKVAVFLDGCFWHGCKKCYRQPKTNSAFWQKKIEGNIARDKKVNRLLKKEGVTVVRIWQHAMKVDPVKSITRIKTNLL